VIARGLRNRCASCDVASTAAKRTSGQSHRCIAISGGLSPRGGSLFTRDLVRMRVNSGLFTVRLPHMCCNPNTEILHCLMRRVATTLSPVSCCNHTNLSEAMAEAMWQPPARNLLVQLPYQSLHIETEFNSSGSEETEERSGYLTHAK